MPRPRRVPGESGGGDKQCGGNHERHAGHVPVLAGSDRPGEAQRKYERPHQIGDALDAVVGALKLTLLGMPDMPLSGTTAQYIG